MKLKYEKIILALPPLGDMSSNREWKIAADFRRLGFHVTEVNSFNILLPQLLSPIPYLAVIHTDIMNLFEITHSHRATILTFAELMDKNTYCLWDPRDRWEVMPSEKNVTVEVWKIQSHDELIKNIAKNLQQNESRLKPS